MVALAAPDSASWEPSVRRTSWRVVWGVILAARRKRRQGFSGFTTCLVADSTDGQTQREFDLWLRRELKTSTALEVSGIASSRPFFDHVAGTVHTPVSGSRSSHRIAQRALLRAPVRTSNLKKSAHIPASASSAAHKLFNSSCDNRRVRTSSLNRPTPYLPLRKRQRCALGFPRARPGLHPLRP
jgi:hypothetical protein